MAESCPLQESLGLLRLFDVGKPGSEAWNADCKSSAAGKKPTRFCLSRWSPQAAKGMLPHFVRKIHHLHGISRRHNQQTSPGESFAGGASNKWLWHRPPEHHCNPATAPYLSLFGVSSPSMRPQLGCHPRSPTIQVPQNKASENS